MNNFNQAAPSGRDSFAQKNSRPLSEAATAQAHSTAKPAPINQRLAAEILVHQANEIQTIARDFIQQGHPTADLNLLQRAARAVVVTGTLLERLGGAHEHH
ncbi:MAG: hypothetical protein PHF20_05675 [Halothiobacillaceae bacterium]|nr:hypothetical protein [Halothiobacillaceae bacterium]